MKRIYKIKYEKSDTSDVGRYVSSLLPFIRYTPQA